MTTRMLFRPALSKTALALVLTFAAATAPSLAGNQKTMTHTRTNQMVEWSFTSQKSYVDPFNQVELDVVVTGPGGETRRVPAFWAGGQAWRARYSSGQMGVHHYRTECSDTMNKDLQGVEGSVDVEAYHGPNPLCQHGAPRVAADRRHFEYADGTPFFWLADTWWMGLCKRLAWPADFKKLTVDRVEKGFTVVQIVGGLYPDMPAFDERGANEAGFPWTPDYSRINPAYFDSADRRIAHLVDSGISPCIVGAWGYHLPWLGVERMKKHWRNLVARYGAYPVFWCVAGEGLMPYYLAKDASADREFQKKGWTQVAAYLRQVDPYHHPISIHPTDSSRSQLEDQGLLDFDMLQTGHGDRASIPPTVSMVRTSYAAAPTMPTINSEVCYEGILGTCPADVERFMVWSCLLSGAAGHTYGANGIWQVNQRGIPYGKSPHGGNWGNTPWEEAAALPGSRQTGFARRLLEQYPWQRFDPHPGWASFETDDRPFTWGDWIWYPEGNPAKAAPLGRRFFRKTLTIPGDKQVAAATLRLSADDRFTAWVNGKQAGSQEGWRSPAVMDVRSLLHPGKNVIAIEAENMKSDVEFNPAGLLCSLVIEFTGGGKAEVGSDATWNVRQQEAPGWTEVDFDDAAWAHARSIAPYGEGPWGRFTDTETFMVPYTAGIPGGARVTYVPVALAIRVRKLEPGVKYRAQTFDPVTGKTSAPTSATADAHGSWTCPPPEGEAHDWVLVMDRV